MKLAINWKYWILLLPVFGSQRVQLSHGSSLADGKSQVSSLSPFSSSPIIINKKLNPNITTTSSPALTKMDFLILNEHPDHIDAYEIPISKISLVEHDEVDKKPERVKKKPAAVVDTSLLALPESALATARTFLIAPLLAAAPVLFAELAAIGGVGIAVPVLIFLPLVVLVPLAIIAFIIYI